MILKRKPNKYQKLIEKCCKHPKNIWANNKVKFKELSHAKALFKRFPDEFFWDKLYLPFKIKSLIWFLGENGKKYLYLEEKRQKLELSEKRDIKLEKEKIGEDFNVNPKPQTLLEFLDDGKSKKNK